jgi:hypothetical protein
MSNEMNPQIKERYGKLYRRLKSTVPDLLEEERVPNGIRRQILTVVSNLPHPSVANLRDIRDVCLICKAGVLEYFYHHIREEVDELCRMIIDVLKEEAVEPFAVPPSPERPYDLQSIGMMLYWANRNISSIHNIVTKILGLTDITLKGQCPYCDGPLVVFVDLNSNELRIQCKNKPQRECSKAIWIIQQVRNP